MPSRIQNIKTHIPFVKIKELAQYGYILCSIDGYEFYTMEEIIYDFVHTLPCFFVSYNHLETLYSENYTETNDRLFQLRLDLAEPPASFHASHVARIIQHYFTSLPWLKN